MTAEQKSHARPIGECDEDAIDRRIVIRRDDSSCTEQRDDWDHAFVLYSNLRHYRGDKDAECPYEEDDDGNAKLREGIVAFPVSMYEHGGVSYHLGSYGGHDAMWDSVDCAYWLYTDCDHYEMMFGKGSWKDATEERLRNIAKCEVEEMNLIADGMYFSYECEVKRKWTKRYEDGTSMHGCDWECEDSCGGYLTEDAESIDCPVDAPVFYHDDASVIF